MNIGLRTGKPDDAETCGSICCEAFRAIADRHNFPPDFPDPNVAIGLLSQLFSRSDIYSVVAELDGRVVGSNFLWENAVIAGVGPITVDPGVQNVAVGRRLMEDVLHRARERRFAGARLVQAAYHNRSLSLYTKLGFDAREPLSLLQGPAIGLKLLGYAVRSANEDDLEACNKLCLRGAWARSRAGTAGRNQARERDSSRAAWSHHRVYDNGWLLRACCRREQRRSESAYRRGHSFYRSGVFVADA